MARESDGPNIGGSGVQSNKGMKLTKLSAAWLPEWTCRLMPALVSSDAGTASQLIPGVRWASGTGSLGTSVARALSALPSTAERTSAATPRLCAASAVVPEPMLGGATHVLAGKSARARGPDELVQVMHRKRRSMRSSANGFG